MILARSVVIAKTLVRRGLAKRAFSSYGAGESITYSGGQATEGQGGYYGSGGARVLPTTTAEHHTELLALAADVEKIDVTMKELEVLESLLSSEETNKVTSKSIELRQNIKKLMTSPEFLDSLNRLEVNGQPIWGLNSDEREMITLAREKVTKV